MNSIQNFTVGKYLCPGLKFNTTKKIQHFHSDRKRVVKNQMLITITEVISCNYVQRAIKKIRNIKDTRVEFIYC